MEQVYTLSDQDFTNLLETLNEQGFEQDGCKCGCFVYKLEDGNFLTMWRGCHKGNSCPSGQAWALEEPEFHADCPNNEYAERSYPSLPWKLNHIQLRELMCVAREVSLRQLGIDEYWNDINRTITLICVCGEHSVLDFICLLEQDLKNAGKDVPSILQEKLLESVTHSLRMEGLDVPRDAVEDGRLLLEGKVTADELVEKYKKRYEKSEANKEML